MLVDHSLFMDLAVNNPTPIIHIKQGDVWAHAIKLAVYEAGKAWSGAWSLPASGGAADVNAVVRYRKPDGYCGTYDKLPDGSKAVTATNNVLTIALAPQLAAVPGMVDIDVQINAPQTAVATYARAIAIFNLRLNVEAHPMDTQNVEANNYECTTLQEINEALGKTVRTVNGVKPDAGGNVTVQIPSSGVTAVNGRQGSVHLAVNALVECKTPSDHPTKEVAAVDGFAMIAGAVLAVKFSYSNTAEAPRLSYAGNEMIILDRLTGKPVDPGDITAGVYHFQVSATGWLLLDKQESEGATPVPGDKGEDGGYWIPSVADDGTLTWEASKDGMGEAPATINIKGPAGDQGPAGPKGDPGEIGPQGNPGKDGVTPNLQIGAVTTLPAGSQATAKITGTAANPVLSLGIPQGADAAGGSIGVTAGYGRCSDVPDAVTKSVAIQTEGMKVIDGSTLLVLFDAPNTAADVMLNINGSMLAICDSCGNPANAATMAGDIHLFALLPAMHSAILINPTTATTLSAAVERGLTS